MGNNYQEFLKKLRNVDDIEVPNAYTCQRTAIWLRKLFEYLTGNKWLVEIDLNTGCIYFEPPKKRHENGGISVADWRDICRYIGIGIIPYKLHRYKIFADEVLDTLKVLVNHVGKGKAKKILNDRETNNCRAIW